jgi:hypothetical protein
LVIDPTGNNGKTHFTNYVDGKKLAVTVPSLPEYKDIVQALCDKLEGRKNRDPRLIILDMPRAKDKRKVAGMMAAMETIKNGLAIETRYKYREWKFKKPQLWIFSNSDVDRSLMSEDRWKVWKIDQNKSLVRMV